jgi:hypothetical protein
MNQQDSQHRNAWNKGQIVGQKRAFSLEEIGLIESFLQETENWHDLALLSFGLDTMFRASDLLQAVQHRHQAILRDTSAFD